MCLFSLFAVIQRATHFSFIFLCFVSDARNINAFFIEREYILQVLLHT